MEKVLYCTSVFLLIVRTYGFLVDGNNQNFSLEERLTKLEAEYVLLRNELTEVSGCALDFCGKRDYCIFASDGFGWEHPDREIHWSKWSTWSAWTQCTGQCNQGYGSSQQTRTRTRQCLNQGSDVQGTKCTGDVTETDTRPCNAVELYGCLNAQNTNNTGNQYGMVYNFFDELAQSACTAAVKTPSHVLALRRNCATGNAAECAVICANAGYTCFDELHVYPPHNVLHPNVYTDEGKPGLMMYRYFSCNYGYGSCGPNYCCCQY